MMPTKDLRHKLDLDSNYKMNTFEMFEIRTISSIPHINDY